MSDWCEEEVNTPSPPPLILNLPCAPLALWWYRFTDLWPTPPVRLSFFFFITTCTCRRNWSWRLWTMPTASRRHTSTPTCAAPWFSSVSRSWWVLFSSHFLNMRFKEPEELSVNFHFLFVIVKNKMCRCCVCFFVSPPGRYWWSSAWLTPWWFSGWSQPCSSLTDHGSFWATTPTPARWCWGPWPTTSSSLSWLG